LVLGNALEDAIGFAVSDPMKELMTPIKKDTAIQRTLIMIKTGQQT